MLAQDLTCDSVQLLLSSCICNCCCWLLLAAEDPVALAAATAAMLQSYAVRSTAEHMPTATRGVQQARCALLSSADQLHRVDETGDSNT